MPLVDSLLDWAGALLTGLIAAGTPLVEAHGNTGVFLVLMSETLFFTGLLVPGYAVLIAAGYLAAGPELQGAPTVLAAWLGAVVGDQGSYLLGRVFGLRLIRRKKREEAARLQTALHQEGPWLLLTYHYAPPVRALLPVVAGCVGLSPRRWLVWDVPGVLLWVATGLSLGALTRRGLSTEGSLLVQLLSLASAVVVVACIWRLRRRLQLIAKRAGADATAPPTSEDSRQATDHELG